MAFFGLPCLNFVVLVYTKLQQGVSQDDISIQAAVSQWNLEKSNTWRRYGSFLLILSVSLRNE